MKKPKYSRQYRWQKKHLQFRQCILCGKDIEEGLGSFLCLKHAIAKRERARAKLSRKRRYNSLTYRMERQLKEQEAA